MSDQKDVKPITPVISVNQIEPGDHTIPTVKKVSEMSLTRFYFKKFLRRLGLNSKISGEIITDISKEPAKEIKQ